MTEKDIYEGVLGHDPKVIDYIYQEIYPLIKTHIKSNSGTEDDAMDVFQDGMDIIYGVVNSGKYYEKNWRGFLFEVCKRVWLNILRKRQRMLGDEKVDVDRLAIVDETEPWELFLIPSMPDLVKEKLQEISPDCEKLLIQQFLEEKRQAEIAEMLGYTLKFIRVKAWRCKEELKKLLVEDPRFQYHMS